MDRKKQSNRILVAIIQKKRYERLPEMLTLEFFIFFSYFIILTTVVFISYRKQKSDIDFVIGNRSLNYWLTAFSAHASDMSNWLFMGYPALIFMTGIFNIWAAIGLTFFMFLNWQYVAPRIRIFTEETNSLTLNTYFEKRFHDYSGILRIFSAFFTFIFYTFYISAGLIGLGYLIESLFGFNYVLGITIGLGIVSFYVFLGGYNTVAWIDLFQGLFLLGLIILLPLYLLFHLGGFSPILETIHMKHLTSSLFPDFSSKTFLQIFWISCAWGLGYFGQPHIITKFMGIKDVKEMKKAKYLGISWQALSLGGATLFGLLGILIFPHGLYKPELITLEIVKVSLSPLFSGLTLCAIIAATTNVISAQILVVASILSEDIYKKLIKKQITHKKLLWISRYSVIVIAIISFFIAYFQVSTIYSLVLYSWSGLGAAFGPLLIFSLYWEKVSKLAAFAGIIVGGVTAGLWPPIANLLQSQVPAMIMGFLLSSLTIFLFSIKKRSSYSLKKL